MPARPAAVAFDLFQTLFSLEPIRASLVGFGLPAMALELWFARTLRDGFALAATDVYRSFQAVAAGTLRGLVTEQGLQISSGKLTEVLESMQSLPPQPEANAAMTSLRDAGVRIFALTNGGEAGARALIGKAGLTDFVEQIVSIDHVNAWKPRPEPYRRVVQVADLDASEMALIAAHAWDCHGARQAGLITGWVSRTEKVFNPMLGHPDVEGENLAVVCEALLRLPNRTPSAIQNDHG